MRKNEQDIMIKTIADEYRQKFQCLHFRNTAKDEETENWYNERFEKHHYTYMTLVSMYKEMHGNMEELEKALLHENDYIDLFYTV